MTNSHEPPNPHLTDENALGPRIPQSSSGKTAHIGFKENRENCYFGKNFQSGKIVTDLLKEVEKCTFNDENGTHIVDPVFGIVRNRVNAEVAKTYFRMNSPEKGVQLMKYVLSTQAEDGSWNEIHPNYNQKSSLITAFIGSALVIAYPHFPQDVALEKVKAYVLQNEKKPGYFVKSQTYTADHLNVDASCGAFLAEYGNRFSDTVTIDAARRAAQRVCRFQKNGYFPYASDKGNYPYIFNFPCIHYQGVTLYYLSKIQKIIDEPWLEKSLLSGTEWLASVQREDGFFDWSKSGLMFAYYLTGAYAFAYAVFSSQSRGNSEYSDNALRCLKVLEKNIPSLALRWETASRASFFVPRLITVKSAFLGDFPLRHRLFRTGYGYYRQISRRRIRSDVDEKTFIALCRFLHISPSTIEPMNNFPDMFMTSEILDCLSSARCDVR
ncbi:MAG: terpene cyclase/mutase family protein [Methanomicrobiales archaeon]|nr:terpene cyclase/mutase family protein [Methanomicrobiales archaeon]